MDGVNKTLYIPLYGKAKVSKKNIISEVSLLILHKDEHY